MNEVPFGGSASEIHPNLQLLEEHGKRIGTLQNLLIEGEKSGSTGQLNINSIKRKARRRIHQP